MNELKSQVEDLEKKVLQAKLENLEKEIYLLKSKNNTDKDNKKEIFNNFFNDNIRIDKGKRINTASVLRKANEYAETYRLRFTKFEVADLMLSKGIERKKVGGINYYYNIVFE